MASRDTVDRALFALTLRNARGGRSKRLQAEAGEILRALKLPRRRGAQRPATAVELAARQAARAEVVALRRPLSEFAEDVSRLVKASRERLQKASRDAAREARILRIRELMAQSPRVLHLGLREDQAQTLGGLLGHRWGTPVHEAASRASQRAAEALSAGLKAVWDEALPPGRTLEQALSDVWTALSAARHAEPSLSASEFVRGRLFDNWRNRFMNRLAQNTGLCERLAEQAGLKVLRDKSGAAPRFLLSLKAGDTPFEVGLDIDHAEQRLVEAVEQALAAGSPAPLKPIVQGSSLQLALPLENQVVFEFLRRQNRLAARMKSTSPALMTLDDEIERLAALERELQALEGWGPWEG